MYQEGVLQSTDTFFYFKPIVMNETLDSSRYKRFESLELLARQVVEGFLTGLHKSPFHGFSVEFAEHRIYNAGESTRNIDWRLFGRTEKLYVKRFEEETNLRCQLIIDSSSSMFFPYKDKKATAGMTKIDFAIQAAASIIYILRKQRDASGISIFNDRLTTHTPAKSSPSHVKMLFTLLSKMFIHDERTLNEKSAPAKIIHEIAEKLPKRSLVVIFSDMMDNVSNPDDIYNALLHLRHNKHEVILFHIFDRKKELELGYENKPHLFIDMETGKEMKLNPAQVKESYTLALGKFHEELKLKCMQYKIDFIPADINEGFESILMSFFSKRSKLY
jgi:uncharacterized protein (DUF58 family)